MHWAARVITVGLLVCLSLATSADSLTGKVVKITDGDILYILDANYQQHKIRLAGIDVPERKQAYGLASRKHLASIVVDQQDQNTDVFIPNTDDVRHLMSELRGASRCTAKRPNERFVMKHQLELISFCV